MVFRVTDDEQGSSYEYIDIPSSPGDLDIRWDSSKCDNGSPGKTQRFTFEQKSGYHIYIVKDSVNTKLVQVGFVFMYMTYL